MSTYTKEELASILEAHAKWLRGEKDGVHADLSYADLSYADLSYANLIGSNLSGSNLSYADLHSAWT